MAMDDTQKKDGIFKAMSDGVKDAKDIVAEIGERLLNSVDSLRVEQTESTFTGLSQVLENLSQLIEFIQGLNNSIKQFNTLEPNINIPEESMACWGQSINIFKEMQSAFEREDWILLADLIQYEVYPLLKEGEKSLVNLFDKYLDKGSDCLEQ